MKITTQEVVTALGVLGAVATFLSQHGLQLDATSISGLVAVVFALFNQTSSRLSGASAQ